MAGVNKAIIVGYLGKDPEIRYLQNQNSTAVCNMSVATSRKYTRGQGGETVEETEWHRIVVWGKMAENCNQYLAKGRQVYVEGRLRTTEYEKDGIKRYSTQIVAEVVQFLGGRGEGGGGSRPSGGGGGTQQQPYVPAVDGDIPF